MVVVKILSFTHFVSIICCQLLEKHICIYSKWKSCWTFKNSQSCRCFARRLQIQEQMTEQICDALNEHLKPKRICSYCRCKTYVYGNARSAKNMFYNYNFFFKRTFKSDKKQKMSFEYSFSFFSKKQILKQKETQIGTR